MGWPGPHVTRPSPPIEGGIDRGALMHPPSWTYRMDLARGVTILMYFNPFVGLEPASAEERKRDDMRPEPTATCEIGQPLAP